VTNIEDYSRLSVSFCIGLDLWSIKPELTSSYARQSGVFPPSGDGGCLYNSALTKH
jgi:hypothetical protein